MQSSLPLWLKHVCACWPSDLNSKSRSAENLSGRFPLAAMGGNWDVHPALTPDKTLQELCAAGIRNRGSIASFAPYCRKTPAPDTRFVTTIITLTH